jgi:hypothetical protein
VRIHNIGATMDDEFLKKKLNISDCDFERNSRFQHCHFHRMCTPSSTCAQSYSFHVLCCGRCCRPVSFCCDKCSFGKYRNSTRVGLVFDTFLSLLHDCYRMKDLTGRVLIVGHEKGVLNFEFQHRYFISVLPRMRLLD